MNNFRLTAAALAIALDGCAVTEPQTKVASE